MKEKKQLKAYRAPECQLVPVETTYLMETSFPNSGGHNKAGDDGDDLNAKQGWFDEGEEESAPQQWEN